MSQNKSFAQLDVSLLILCFYKFFGSICGGILGCYFVKSTTNQSFALIARESTKVGTKRAGYGNKIIFCPALIGCFRREIMSPDHLVNLRAFLCLIVCLSMANELFYHILKFMHKLLPFMYGFH